MSGALINDIDKAGIAVSAETVSAITDAHATSGSSIAIDRTVEPQRRHHTLTAQGCNITAQSMCSLL